MLVRTGKSSSCASRILPRVTSLASVDGGDARDRRNLVRVHMLDFRHARLALGLGLRVRMEPYHAGQATGETQFERTLMSGQCRGDRLRQAEQAGAWGVRNGLGRNSDQTRGEVQCTTRALRFAEQREAAWLNRTRPIKWLCDGPNASTSFWDGRSWLRGMMPAIVPTRQAGRN